MSRTFARGAPPQPDFDIEAAGEAVDAGEALVLDLDGFEGPLHLLLALARRQKVDLTRLSITALADQYLAYLKAAGPLRFSLAADYLVMAAWLIYLKSRLLLPDAQAGEAPPAQVQADALARRLARLDAMRRAAAALEARPQLGRDVFVRPGVCAADVATTALASRAPEADLLQLVLAYAGQRRRRAAMSYPAQARSEAYPLEDARTLLRDWLGRRAEWTALEAIAPRARAIISPTVSPCGPTRASYVASTFAASLEMAREGDLELRQAGAFADLYVRARPVDEATGAPIESRAA